MDIDLSSIIISLVILSFFIIPIVYDQLSKGKGKRKINKQFLGSANSQSMNVTDHDVWDDAYAIGIDVSSGKLLYLNQRVENGKQILVDLHEVKRCRISNSSRNIQTKRSSTNVTDRLELVCSFKNSGKPDLVLELYRSDKSGNLSEANSLARKWADLINSNLS